MVHDWQKLTKMTGGKEIQITRVKLSGEDISLEGCFELPPMAKLTMEEQIFAATFIKTHGSIKQMEKLFGISYPTVKNRLNRIGEKLDFVNVGSDFSTSRRDILDRLEKGELSVSEALEAMS